MRKWTLCSKRMPKYTGWYFVTKERHGQRYVEEAFFTTADPDGWNDAVKKRGETIAWKPWPKPYMGREKGNGRKMDQDQRKTAG